MHLFNHIYKNKNTDKKTDKKNCVIYSRLSSSTKSKYNISNMSLNTQIHICTQYAKTNNYQIKKIYQEVKSARDITKLKQLNITLEENKETTLLISTVDRFSRNTLQGLEYLQKFTDKKINIIFVSDLINSKDNKFMIRNKLSFAEKESDMISERVKRSLNNKRRRGEFIGNIAPYGYMIYQKNGRRYKKVNNYEQKVNEFIIAIKNGIINSKQATVKMFNICDKKFKDMPIKFFDVDDTEINTFNKTNTLNFQEIANLLNEYEIPYRNNKKWTNRYVNNIYKKEKNSDLVIKFTKMKLNL